MHISCGSPTAHGLCVGLVSTELLMPGAEVVWNYGEMYRRTYKAGRSSVVPAGSDGLLAERAEKLFEVHGFGRELFTYDEDVDHESGDESYDES